ncbi:MAG: dipeptide ABC transporter ATP-binding protein [Desulfuromonas sp.]|nr:dipeptide ABC transporter ATP-binding protein [Desulfuromonas sp.]
MTPLLELKDLHKSFRVAGGKRGFSHSMLPAVAGVSLTLNKGQTLGLVGESGCGKSTISKLIMGLLRPDSGSIRFRDQELSQLNARQWRPLRSQMQMIFQDPYASLNPRMTVNAILNEPFAIHTKLNQQQRRDKVASLLEKVGLEPWHGQRYPHEFSGGQRQRIGIARALALQPELIIADEPVSALDLSIQAQIINLLDSLQEEFGLTYLFISHDLSVVEHLCDQVAVMYLGQIVEQAPVEQFYRQPAHPYSEALLQALPVADPTRTAHRLPQGEVPSPLDPPPGCPFHPRCPYAISICRQQPPALLEIADQHVVACHRSGELNLGGIS